MPSVTIYIAVMGLFLYFSGNLRSDTFTFLLGFWLLWEMLRELIGKFGYVRKTKYQELEAKNNELRDSLEVYSRQVDDLLKKFNPVIKKYGPEFVKGIRIEANRNVYNLYLNNRAAFMDYVTRYAENLKAQEEQEKAKEEQESRKARSTGTSQDWRKTLGVSQSATYNEVKAAYRTLVRKYHPDNAGGDQVKIREVNSAWDDAEKFFRK